MQTSSRARDTGPSFAARRGHHPQISTSDDGHHVTETIGHMYGEDDAEHGTDRYGRTSNGRRKPLHAARAAFSDHAQQEPTQKRNSIPRKQLPESQTSSGSNRDGTAGKNAEKRPSPDRGYSWEHANGNHSPPLELRGRSPSETATSSFPLNDIDYESSPAAVAQELSNLQALRRMSMDVAAAGDPDLPTLNPAAMPTSPSQSEDDASRLFWVPARLHPELAPKEFKSFLESKAEQIKRRSGELSSFSSPSSSRSSSLGTGDTSGLRRKKSMLSRQITRPDGYEDGADRLEMKRSISRRTAPADPNLQELESLVAEGTGRRTSLEDSKDENGDVILPSIPGSNLKRSTRTTYRRGGSVKGRGIERPSYAQRASRKGGVLPGDEEFPIAASAPSEVPPLPSFQPSSDVVNLAQTLRDPAASPAAAPARSTNFSRPATHTPPSAESTSRASFASTAETLFTRPSESPRSSTSTAPDLSTWPSKQPPRRQRSPDTAPSRQPVPQIIEVPPPDEPAVQQRPSTAPSPVPPHPAQQQSQFPQRGSSREAPPPQRLDTPRRPSMPPKQPSPEFKQRPPSKTNAAPPTQPQPPQSLGEMSSHPSPLPGNDTSTSTLSFIPTLTEDKRADSRKIKDKKEDGKKSTWGWLLGKEEAEKEKPRSKSPKLTERHDNTRLDVLQTSIEGNGKGRESVVLDRESLKLEEERKKESQRRSTGSETKKEKESLFSSIFGGKKVKGEKDSSVKKRPLSRGLSPEPPFRELKPDIDYNWTRFSILEERAIYRMAHIKLANPRRALHSQVLLSNFMYSYLAKVQQMHPQMNLPTSAKQQRKQQQQHQQTRDQPDEFTQYQRYQQQQQREQPVQQPVQEAHDEYNHDRTEERPLSRGSKTGADYGAVRNPSTYDSHNLASSQYATSQRPGEENDDDEMW